MLQFSEVPRLSRQRRDSMESFVQALGEVKLNARSFLHSENFCKNFLVDGLKNVATLDSTSRC